MRLIKTQAIALLVATVLFSGCAGITPYKADLPHNFKINTKTESVKATLHIYSVNAQCHTDYQGSIGLENESIELGLPVGKPSYLVVNFSSSSFWSNSRSQMSHDTFLPARNGYRYELNISYIDDIYNVTLYEVNRRTGNKRELPAKALNACS